MIFYSYVNHYQRVGNILICSPLFGKHREKIIGSVLKYFDGNAMQLVGSIPQSVLIHNPSTKQCVHTEGSSLRIKDTMTIEESVRTWNMYHVYIYIYIYNYHVLYIYINIICTYIISMSYVYICSF